MPDQEKGRDKKPKHEWKRMEKNLYLPKSIPELITVPQQRFFMLKGKGNPNSHSFAEKVGVLYSLSYAVKMMPKQDVLLQAGRDYDKCE